MAASRRTGLPHPADDRDHGTDAGPGRKCARDEELLVRVKVRGYGRGRLTVEASATGGLFACVEIRPGCMRLDRGSTAIGWRVVIEPQWWVHESDFCFVRFGFAGPSPVSLQTPSTRLVTPVPAQLPPATRPRRIFWAWSSNH